MESTTDIRRIHTINNYLKAHFGEKVIKLSLDGGFTCPNRDGTKGIGGCIFCSPEGSGELSSSNINDQIQLLKEKWPNTNKYIAYFQSHTNTYGLVSDLEKMYKDALSSPGIVGLAIATRPDCLSEEVLNLLGKLNKETFLWVELGLQTIHPKTSQVINRCHPLSDYDAAVQGLASRGIKTVTHLILGLPGETKEAMLQSVQYICKPLSLGSDNDKLNSRYIFGIKLHLLNVVKGSQMNRLFPTYCSFDSIEEYVALVSECLKIIPWDITLHRLTGDVPRRILVSPDWSYKKRTILNGIAHKMRSDNIVQGEGTLE